MTLFTDRPTADQAEPKGKSPASSNTRRVWLMRLISVGIVPALFLGGIEFALRIGGYGFEVRYFQPSRISGIDYLIPNERFSERFFPPALARSPALLRMRAEKPDGTYRIFLFGESAALGDPDPTYGMGRYLEILLEARYPGTDFEVICTAMTAINSHVILPIARECARLDGDLWLIYMGNNEMVGPFGASTIFGTRAPSRAVVRILLALKSTRLGQLIAKLASGIGTEGAVPAAWAGIDMFKQNQLRADDPARLRAYQNFEGNLRDILQAGREAGVPVLLSTVASNLADCAPFASLHRANLEPSAEAEWNRLFSSARELETAGHFTEALHAYQQAAALDDSFAELQYRLGICHLALNHPDEARLHLVRARDNDALAVRADSTINRILVKTANDAGAGIIPVDAETDLAVQSPSRIPGRAFFYEHVHLTTEGNDRLARILADRIAALRPVPIGETPATPWLDTEDCDERLALTRWDQLRLWKEAYGRVSVPPFTAQTSHPANAAYLQERVREVQMLITSVTPRLDRRLYERALARRPNDPSLIGNFAQYLDGTGATTEAIVQAERFRDLLPELSWAHFYLGALLQKAERPAEAGVAFNRALEIRPDFRLAEEALRQLPVGSR